jgi:nucleoside phosphorylase
MVSRNSPPIFVSELRNSASACNWLDEKTPKGLATRCLLDALEYLHTAPKYPGRFWHVVNAHAIRLVHRCLTDRSLNRGDVLNRMTRHIEETCQQLQESRQPSIPFYGDDFWDWASVVNAFCEVRLVSHRAAAEAKGELESFFEAVVDRLPNDLSIGDPDREWYGPATAALAYRVLDRHLDKDAWDCENTLDELESQALQKVENEKYRGHDVLPPYELWHYGQVVANFKKKASDQARRLADFSWLDKPMENDERVYMLARVLQGAYAAEDRPTRDRALQELYKYQNLARPLGQGLMGDVVKGSLNVLDALWPNLKDSEKTSMGPILDALLFQYTKANTIGFMVAIPHEMDAIVEELQRIGARVERKDGAATVRHPNFHAVIRQGKSIPEISAATNDLIKIHRVKYIIMSGIAGSLGTSDGKDGWDGPDVGDVVIAASMAPFGIRDKQREEVVIAKVPFAGSAWWSIPTDPLLFRLAHLVADKSSGDFRVLFEGTIVSRPGIMDSKTRKQDCLDVFPGGLAIEEEGYPACLACLVSGVPFLNIRGVSDRADGSKYFQSTVLSLETFQQKTAARGAAQLAVKVADILSQQW